MTDARTFAIVGAGLAGAKAAEALRTDGFDGRIVLLGAERAPTLRAATAVQGIPAGQRRPRHRLRAPAGVVRRAPGRPAARHRGDRGRPPRPRARHRATGAGCATTSCCSPPAPHPAACRCPASDLAGVHYLRSLDDSDRLKAAFRPGARVVIIGGGWIGLETAAAARTAGAEVTVLEQAELPLLRVLGPEVATVFADLHTRPRRRPALRVTVAAIRPAATDPTTAGGVQLGDGTALDADVIVVGVGVTPNVELARACLLDVDNGVLVDEHLRTSDDDICAAGDVANAYHPLLGRQLRVEHWANALNQPRRRRHRRCSVEPATYDRLPYFFTDQYDLGMEYTGYAEPDGYDQVVIRGDARRAGVHRVLATRRSRGGRDERQHLGRDRPDHAPDPIRRTSRPHPSRRRRRPDVTAAGCHARCTTTVSRTAESSTAAGPCRSAGMTRWSPAHGLPAVGDSREAHPAVQDLQGRLARAAVVGQLGPGDERDHRLPQRVLVAALHRAGAPAVPGCASRAQLLVDQRGQGQEVHPQPPSVGFRPPAAAHRW